MTHQKTDNGSKDILRALHQADGINMTLYTTGPFADDGILQVTNIFIVPNEHSSNKDIPYDASAQYIRDGISIQYLLMNGKLYQVQRNASTNDLINAECAHRSTLPPLDKILTSVLEAQVVEEGHPYYNLMKCSDEKHRLVNAIWADQYYFYCYDAETSKLLSFRGPYLAATINYLDNVSTVNAQNTLMKLPESPKPECENVDFKSIESPQAILSKQLTNSRKRSLQLIPGSDPEQLTYFGQCVYEATGEDMSFNFFEGLVMPPLTSVQSSYTLPQSISVSLRRSRTRKLLLSGSVQEGLPCIFIHGSGIDSKKAPGIYSSFPEYWGMTDDMKPCYCSTVRFVVLDTLTRSYDDPNLLVEFQQLVNSEISPDNNARSRVVYITHGAGTLMLAAAVNQGFIVMDRKVPSAWVALGPATGGQLTINTMNQDCASKKVTSFQNILAKMSNGTIELKKKYPGYPTCRTKDKVGFQSTLSGLIPQGIISTIVTYVSKGMCGYDLNLNAEDKALFVKAVYGSTWTSMIYNDGMIDLRHCLPTDNQHEYTLFPGNHFEFQMQYADRMGILGPRRWLNEIVSEAFKSYALPKIQVKT